MQFPHLPPHVMVVGPPRCIICDRQIAGAPPDHNMHVACVTCPNCGSTFSVWRPPSVSEGRNCAELRCMSCLHPWNGPNVAGGHAHE